MRDAQQQAADFAREHGLSLSAQGRFIDLVSEIGELGKEILKQPAMRRSHLPTIRRLRRRWADCLFSILCLCSCLGLDAQDALELALQKYEERFVEKVMSAPEKRFKNGKR